MVNCLICQSELLGSGRNTGVCATCDAPQPGTAAMSGQLFQELTEIIHYANDHSPRSLQTEIGPSELGTQCDRRLAYRLANNPEVNRRRDPWPAIVGTAIHHWMEAGVNLYQSDLGLDTYKTEQELTVDPLVIGHTDLYREGVVVDYKSASPDMMKKYVKYGPPAGYRVQINLYAKGHMNAGREVRYVSLIFLPRAGWLSGMHVWTDIYRPELAQRALDRMYSIGQGLLAVDIGNHPEVYEQIPATEDHCGYCPFFKREGTLLGADNTGCPGA